MTLIDRDALLTAYDEQHEGKPGKARKLIEDAPEAVVRCKDCKHRDPEDKKCDCGNLHHAGTIFPVPDNYFCADGERRTE